jgi:hypothetical protein
MAFAIIILLYVTIGLLAAAGSIFIANRLFSPKAEQIFFALFLIPIAGFYLAFTAYFSDGTAWRLETGAVIVFTILALLGVRVPVVLMLGYFLHGLWDIVHEMHAHAGVDLFGAGRVTEIPLAYGAFCLAYDWCLVAYFYSRRRDFSAAWKAGPTYRAPHLARTT